MLRKFLVFAVVLSVMAGMMVACGEEEDEGEEDSSAGQSESAEAGETTARQIDAMQVAYKNTTSETARVAFNMNTDMTGAPADPNTTAQPAAMELSMNGKGVVDFPNEEMQMSVEMGPMGSFQMRTVDDVAYQKMPQQMRAQMEGGKPWIEMDLDAFYEQQYGMSYSEMQSGASTDPTRQLEYLRGISGSVEKVGKEEVRGVPTTHYQAVIDLEKAFAEQGSGTTGETYEEMVRQMGISEVPVDVWIDEEDRVRRYRLDMKADAPPAGQPTQGGATVGSMKARITMTQEYFDFGLPVNVSPPPPEKTMSFEELQRQMPQWQGQQRQGQQRQAAQPARS